MEVNTCPHNGAILISVYSVVSHARSYGRIVSDFERVSWAFRFDLDCLLKETASRFTHLTTSMNIF